MSRDSNPHLQRTFKTKHLYELSDLTARPSHLSLINLQIKIMNLKLGRGTRNPSCGYDLLEETSSLLKSWNVKKIQNLTSNKMIFIIFPSLPFNLKNPNSQTAPSLKASIPQIFFQNSSTFLEKNNWKSFIWRKVFIPWQFEIVSDDFLITIFNLSENRMNLLFVDFNLFWRKKIP